MSIPEEAGKVASSTIEAMKSVPLAIALLVVNIMFLGFSGYILNTVANNASERNKQQLEMITTLIKDCRPPAKTGMRSLLYRDTITPEELK